VKSITINFDLPEDQVLALAQMCQRLSYEDAKRFANPHDGGLEREAILDATIALQRALRDAGNGSTWRQTVRSQPSGLP
jgi:hypothetical protein